MLESWIVEYAESDGTLMTFSCEAMDADDARQQCLAATYAARICSTYRRY